MEFNKDIVETIKDKSTSKIKENDAIEKRKLYNLMQDEAVIYLIFREYQGNYYLANNLPTLINDETPAYSVVCETAESWERVCKDKIEGQTLPVTLPDYIVNGLRSRLKKEIRLTLFKEYKDFENKEGGFLGANYSKITSIKDRFNTAKIQLNSIIDSISDIKSFFDFRMLIEKEGALKVYLLDLYGKN
jgi:hypothetical protein